MADHDLGLAPSSCEQGAEPQAQRLDAQQVDLLPEQPARVVFAKAGGLDQRLGFVRVGVGDERGFGLGKHRASRR